MSTKTELQSLELYRIALENVGAQEEIATLMTEVGYDESVIAEGKTIYQDCLLAYNQNRKENDEVGVAYPWSISRNESNYMPFIPCTAKKHR